MKLSIIIPTYNEELYIGKCLQSLINNDWDFSDTEFIISDGMSSDNTKKIIDNIKKKHPDISILIIENRKRKQVYALNDMIRRASGEFILRCDAHSCYPSKYIVHLVSYLEEYNSVGNVGLPSKPSAGDETFKARIISKALCSPLGIGFSHRNKDNITKEINVDTVLFGAWKKEIFSEVGLFDENFIRGQDYEHNFRIRKANKKVVIVPGTPFKYYTRRRISDLAKMMFQYGTCKIQMMKKHKAVPNFRSFLPFLFFLLLMIFCFFNIKISLGIIVFYFFCILSYTSFVNRNIMESIAESSIIPIMHAAHAYGILYGIYKYMFMSIKKIEWNETR